MASEKVKVTVNLPPDTVEEIKRITAHEGITAGEFLRRAVRTEALLRSIEDSNGKILVEKENQVVQQLVRR